MSSIAALPLSAAESALRAQVPAASVTVVVAPVLAGLLWLSGAVSPAAALGTTALFAFVVSSAGFMLLRAAGVADMPACAAWVLGLFASAMAAYALTAAFHLLAASAFALWGGAVLLFAFVPAARPARAIRVSRADLLALLLGGAATVYWCGELAEVPAHLAREGVLTTWVDQFIHGGVISQFGDPRAAGRELIELADVPPAPYHFATYILPAAFAWALDVPGLPLATSLWTPLGFLTLCAGACALGSGLAGRAGGLAALAVLTLLPDGASYGLHNRLFGFYWYVVAVPGASYAVGMALLSITLLGRWIDTRDVRPLVASFALAVGLAAVKVQIFALLFPAWLIVVGLAVEAVRRRLGLALGAAIVAFAGFVWAFYAFVPDAVPALEQFLDITHNRQQPVAYRGLYGGLMAVYGPGVAVPVGVALVMLATYSMFAFFYPASVWLASRVRRLGPIDAMPLALSASYLLLILAAPLPAHGDATEFGQRPFVLLYAVAAIWTAAGFVRWIDTKGQWHERRVWLPLLVAAALGVIWALHNTVRDWRWNSAYKVAEGLPAAAAFLRSQAVPGDVLAVQGLSPAPVTTDLAVQLVSMTGVPAYLARPFSRTMYGGRLAEVARQRYAALGLLARETDAATALARLRRMGVRWYVVAESDGSGPRWDRERRAAVFVDRMVAVYEAK